MLVNRLIDSGVDILPYVRYAIQKKHFWEIANLTQRCLFQEPKEETSADWIVKMHNKVSKIVAKNYPENKREGMNFEDLSSYMGKFRKL